MAEAWDEALLCLEVAPSSRKTAALYRGARIAVGEALGAPAAEACIAPQTATYKPVDYFLRLRPPASNAPVTTWIGGTSWRPLGDTWLNPAIQPPCSSSSRGRVMGPLPTAAHMVFVLAGGVAVHRLDPVASPASILSLEETWQGLIAPRLAVPLARLLFGRDDTVGEVFGIDTAFSATNAQQNAIFSLQELLLRQDIAQREDLLSAMSSLSLFDIGCAFERKSVHLPGSWPEGLPPTTRTAGGL
jgi:hypothetical protein